MSGNPYQPYHFLISESFDFWDTDVPSIWDASYAGTHSHISGSNMGRRGSECARWHPGASVMNWSMQANMNWVTGNQWCTAGFALAVGTGSQQYPTRGLTLVGHYSLDGTLGLKTGTDGALEVWSNMEAPLGSQTLVASTAAGVLAGGGVYDYVEFYAHISTAYHANNGVYQIWINEVKVLEGTYEFWTSETLGSTVRFGVWAHDSTDVDTDILIDDIYRISGDEVLTRRVFGDVEVSACWPKTPDAGSVDDNDWLLGAGTDKTSSQVDAHTDNDGDTTYIYTSSIGARQSWEMDLPPVNTSGPPRDYGLITVYSGLKAQGSSGSNGTVEYYVTHLGGSDYSQFIDNGSSGNTTLAHYAWGPQAAWFANDPGIVTTTLFDDVTFHEARWGVLLNGLTGTQMRMSTFVVQVCLPKSMVAAPTRRSYVTQI